MIDHDFDPYALLEKLARQQRDQAQQMEVMVQMLMNHKDIINQLIEANNKNVDLIKNLMLKEHDGH